MSGREATALLVLCAAAIAGSPASGSGAPPAAGQARKPAGDTELRFWLEDMLWWHGYSNDEVSAATGLSAADVAQEARRLGVVPGRRPVAGPEEPLRLLPYPGGRHPRIGFLDGAVDPQRETKFSVFTPWDPKSYVVVDLPEAIWSNLGLTYLAHTHVPTVWTKAGITLPQQEWERSADGSLSGTRRLPNGIEFGAVARPGRDGVRMELWLKNGTKEPLSDLRVQICVMLKGAAGFAAQTNDNKVLAAPYAACRDTSGTRWVITAWEQCHRTWANPPCPCMHSDPRFPDCGPGETRRLRGWLSFYTGTDPQAEFKRLDGIVGWRAVGAQQMGRECVQ